MNCPRCGYVVAPITDLLSELMSDPHRHTIDSSIPAHDQGAGRIAREIAVRDFWNGVRTIVREELEEKIPMKRFEIYKDDSQWVAKWFWRLPTEDANLKHGPYLTKALATAAAWFRTR
jgi:hypothetical protein